jgi:hypothetical protein
MGDKGQLSGVRNQGSRVRGQGSEVMENIVWVYFINFGIHALGFGFRL